MKKVIKSENEKRREANNQLQSAKPKKPTRQINVLIFTRAKPNVETMGVEEQLKHCNEFAAKHNYNVIGEFGKLPQYPGTNYASDELQKMVDFIKASPEKISYIIAYQVDRISRAGINIVDITNQLKKLGVTFLFVKASKATALLAPNLNLAFIYAEHGKVARKKKILK